MEMTLKTNPIILRTRAGFVAKTEAESLAPRDPSSPRRTQENSRGRSGTPEDAYTDENPCDKKSRGISSLYKKKLFGCNDPRYYGVRMTDDEIKGIRRSAEKPQPQICSNTHILGRGKGGIHRSRETSTVNKAGGEQHNGARPDHKTYP